MPSLLDIILHVDIYLAQLTQQYGAWTYGILFVILFCETGIVFTPFLPGDSLLFVVGALSATGALDLWLVLVLLCLAAILGDTANYWIGEALGQKIRASGWIKQEYLDRTHAFYEKHGGKAIILARFVPIIRTYAPFVAGIGRMHYAKFLTYNIIGGISWVLLFVLAGYFFGNITFVKQNFSLVILAVIAISFVPLVVEVVKHRMRKQKQ